MTSGDYHLYTKWIPQSLDTTYSASVTGENAYIEFRIVQVGEHLNDADDENSGDGSAITFMAIHALPTSLQLKSASSSNEGGWDATNMKSSHMQEGGYVYDGLGDLAKAALPITKKAAVCSSDSWTVGSSDNNGLWLMSVSELTGTANDNYLVEGVQYEWFKNNSINNTSDEFAVIQGLGAQRDMPNGIPSKVAHASYWTTSTRSPVISSSSNGNFGLIDGAGKIGSYMSTYSYPVVPAFAM